MTISVEAIVMILAIIIHFVAFIGVFTKLENRLTALETTLKILMDALGAKHVITRRNVDREQK